MKKSFFIGFFLCSIGIVHAQKPAKPIISNIYELGNQGVPLNTNFYAYLPTGVADSMQFEFDTTDKFNSPILYKFTNKTRASSWIHRNPDALRLKMNYKLRVRAFANMHTASDWSVASFRSLFGLNTYSPSVNDEVVNLWRPIISYGNPGCHGDFQISDTSDFSRILFNNKLFDDTVVVGNGAIERMAYNLPVNKKLYIRTRVYHFTDTSVWSLRTFRITLTVGLSSPVQTYFYSDLYPDAATLVSSTDDSLFQYHFEIANNASFTGAVKRNVWKIRAGNYQYHAPGSTSYVRYRVSYNGNFTPWSNTRTVTCFANLQNINVQKDFRGYKKLQFYIGKSAPRVQIESDTALTFNTSRRILFDSAAPNSTFYTNYTWERVYKDWINYRNVYTRYRFGDGTSWTAWSKPVYRYMNPVITTNFTNNSHLLQRFDFDTLNAASGYIVQCDTDSTFKSPNLLVRNYARKDWNYFMQFPDIWRKYPRLYFRLLAYNKNGVSGWSHALITNQNAVARIGWPDTTELYRYPDKLSVNAVDGANRLKYQVSYFRDFRSIWTEVNNMNAPLNQPELMVPLDYGTKVYVRAKFYNNIDSTTWSNTWPVKVEYYYNCMLKPILISPPHKSIGVNSKSVLCKWNSVPAATNYLIQFTDMANGKIVYSDFTDSTQIEIIGLPPGKKLEWKVLAIGNKKSQFFSEAFELTTDLSVSNQPVEVVNALKIWPNPSGDVVFVSNLQLKEIKLFDASQRIIGTLPVLNGMVDVSGITAGMYFIADPSASGGKSTRLLIQR
jgi:hypothetical protein